MNTEEKLLVALVVGTALAMFAGSFRYGPEARLFPQAAALVTVFFGVTTVARERIDVGNGDLNLVSQVQSRGELSDQLSDSSGDDRDEGATIGKADPGEFRIDQPVREFAVPFTDRTASLRVVMAVLLLVYLGAAWLVGIFLSSLLFVVLYAWAAELRPTLSLTLVAFTVAALLMFGVWLETPLFRPAHELFTLPEAGL